MNVQSSKENVIYARKPPLGFQIAEGYSHSINLDVVDELIDVNPREAMRLMNIALKMLVGNHPPFEARYQK